MNEWLFFVKQSNPLTPWHISFRCSIVCDWSRFALWVVEFIVSAHDGPLHRVEESFNVGYFVASILLQIGMLPHVDAKDWYALNINHTMHEWVIFVIGLGDQKSSISARTEPDPAGKHASKASSLECLFESIKVWIVLGDRFGKGTKWLVLWVIGCGSEQAEHQKMVVDTTEGKSLRRLIKSGRFHILRELFCLEIFRIRLHTRSNRAKS